MRRNEVEVVLKFVRCKVKGESKSSGLARRRTGWAHAVYITTELHQELAKLPGLRKQIILKKNKLKKKRKRQ